MHDAVPSQEKLDAPRGKRSPVVLRDHVWDAEVCGGLVALKGHTSRIFPVKSTKGKFIKEFSRGSRLRMLKMVARINWSKVKKGVFITLTCPDAVWPKWKEHGVSYRHRFFRDTENYLCKKFGCLWRVEWKPRESGAYKGIVLPHIHLLVPNVAFIAKEVVKSLWKGACQCKGECITWIDALDSKEKHAVYIAKYCAKYSPLSVLDYVAQLNSTGRHWGKHRPSLIPMHESEYYENITLETVAELRGMAACNLPWYDHDTDPGFSIFGKKGIELAAVARRILLDAGERRR